MINGVEKNPLAKKAMRRQNSQGRVTINPITGKGLLDTSDMSIGAEMEATNFNPKNYGKAGTQGKLMTQKNNGDSPKMNRAPSSPSKDNLNSSKINELNVNSKKQFKDYFSSAAKPLSR